MYRRAANRLTKAIARHEWLFRTVVVVTVLTSLMWLVFFTGLQYAVSSSPFWDEFITLWSARRITEGAMSPVQWGPGADALLFRNLAALVLHVFGFDVIVARVPSILMSVATIPVIFFVGKRMFSGRAGLLASAIVVSAPQFLIGGARARPYALLLLLTVLSMFFFYRWLVHHDGDGQVSHHRGWGFVACFVAAVFTHLEAILLLPGFAVAATVSRGPMVFARKKVLLKFALCVLAVVIALAFFLRAETIPGAIPLGQTVWSEVASISVGATNLDVFVKFFRKLPASAGLLLLFLGGVGYLVWDVIRRTVKGPKAQSWLLGESRGPVGRPLGVWKGGQNKGLALLYLLLLWVTGAIVFLLGSIWGSETRYILFLLPLFALVVGATSVRLVTFILHRLGLGGHTTRWWANLGFVVVAIGLMGASTFTDGPRLPQEWGYDLAFEHVGDRWRERDVMVTVAPVACLVSHERCDYIAFQQAYETYAVESEGQLVEAVTGLPLIMTTEEMGELLDDHGRVWFVTDEGRLLSRYNPDFVQLIWDRMHLVANERGAMVFLSSRPRELSLRHEVDVVLEDKFHLLGYHLNGRFFPPGEEIELTLYWRGLDYASYFGTDYSVFVHLVDAVGQLRAQTDGHPVGGLYPTSRWRSTKVVIPDHRSISVPTRIPPGRYRLEVGMYLLPTGERLQVRDQSGEDIGDRVIVDYVKVGETYDAEASPANTLRVNLGDSITMLGYDLAAATAGPGDSVSLTLYWQAREEIQHDYTVFVHLVGQDGGIVSQDDGQPDGGFYPTSYWDKGEVVRDEHVLTVPPVPGVGEYELRVGMYTVEDMQRLPVEGYAADQDWVDVTRISVHDEGS
ncbi:MAG: hypothetical protein GTO63_11820 [Anaerolineae bacterium]|nr:hypothetical protein [Anaerolineae bacterium]NIN95558.1 hypothetical protein [Anaerolineae bacterium]NIQ78551.1 hypothetical protein [Anaerolineae bacterium]